MTPPRRWINRPNCHGSGASFRGVVRLVPRRRASDPPAAQHAMLRYKIILPFMTLLLFIGVFGTTVVTRQASDTAVAEFDSSLLRVSLMANDHFAVLEADRLAQLRAATDTVG